MSSFALSTYIFPSDAWKFVRLEAEKANALVIKRDDLSAFPEYALADELALHIFSFLPQETLGQICRVCRKWNALAKDQSQYIKRLFPSLKFIDEEVWGKYVDLPALGLSVKGAKSPRGDIPILKRLSTLQVEGDLKVTVLTMPRGLTLNKLVKLAGSPKQGNPTCVRYVWNRVSEVLGDIPVEKTYRVALTNNVLNTSRKLPFQDQEKLVNETGCELPGVLAAATLAIMTYISSPQSSPIRLYNDSPATFTRCSEKIDNYTLAVGNFTQNGLAVGTSLFDLDDNGIGAMQKL